MVSSIAMFSATNNPGAFLASPLIQQESLRYSRSFERESFDRFGFENLIASGYDPQSMGEMFENMAYLRRLYGDNIPEFLRTHPITSSRISDAFNAADQVPEIEGKKNSLNYQLVRGRLSAQYEEIPINAVRIFKDRLINEPTIENKYGYFMALMINGMLDESLEQLNLLIREHPKNLILNTSKVETLREAWKI